ncbi:MAG: hypothetical protein JWR85_592 [Marmoricola sp.]|nr:hypothetical protein [Marmoricola sp.]
MTSGDVHVCRHVAPVGEANWGDHSLIALALELVEPMPKLGQRVGSEHQASDPVAFVAQLERWEPQSDSPTVLNEPTPYGGLLPGPRDVPKDMIVGPARSQRSIDEEALTHCDSLAAALPPRESASTRRDPSDLAGASFHRGWTPRLVGLATEDVQALGGLGPGFDRPAEVPLDVDETGGLDRPDQG